MKYSIILLSFCLLSTSCIKVRNERQDKDLSKNNGQQGSEKLTGEQLAFANRVCITLRNKTIDFPRLHINKKFHFSIRENNCAEGSKEKQNVVLVLTESNGILSWSPESYEGRYFDLLPTDQQGPLSNFCLGFLTNKDESDTREITTTLKAKIVFSKPEENKYAYEVKYWRKDFNDTQAVLINTESGVVYLNDKLPSDYNGILFSRKQVKPCLLDSSKKDELEQILTDQIR